jgi:hypothetical protein
MVMMNMCLFYPLNLAFQRFLQLCESSCTLTPQVLLSNYHCFNTPLDIFHIIQHTLLSYLNILCMCPIYLKILSHIHTSLHLRIFNTHYNTSAKPLQTCKHIFCCISETSHTLSYISKYYSCTIQAYCKYLILFTHTTQTAYRIFSILQTFPIMLPQHSRHTELHL